MSAGIRTRNARRYAHVRAAEAFILKSGGEDVTVDQGSPIRLRWRQADMLLTITLSATASDTERATCFARQAIRRRLAAIGVDAGA